MRSLQTVPKKALSLALVLMLGSFQYPQRFKCRMCMYVSVTMCFRFKLALALQKVIFLTSSSSCFLVACEWSKQCCWTWHSSDVIRNQKHFPNDKIECEQKWMRWPLPAMRMHSLLNCKKHINSICSQPNCAPHSPSPSNQTACKKASLR